MTPYYFLRWSVLIFIGLLVYAQTFQFGFVFDDKYFIVDNPHIKDFGHVYLMWHIFPMTRLVGMYSFAFNYYFGQLAPRGYHIFNFTVHLVNAGLVWALAGLIFKITKWLPSQDRLMRELPFIIALLFLVHPCQTQAVTYITQRFESMATMFYLGTMYCYLQARLSEDKAHKITLFGSAGLLCILGILTKEVVITVPAMMLAAEWILFPKKGNTKAYIVLAAGGVLLYLLFTRLVHEDLRVFLQSLPSDSHEGDMLTPARYFLTQMRVFLTFLRLLVLPIHQNLDYDYPASTGLLSPPLTLVGIGVIGGIIFLIIKLRRRIPLIAFGLAWMLITFSINLAPRENLIFEHKLYLISFGFFLASVAALSLWVRDRRALVLILGCIIIVLAIAGFQRNKVWRDDLSLWDDVVGKSPHKARPYINRGLSYAKQGDLTRAIADYTKAIDIRPNYAQAYGDRCYAFESEGNLPQAIADCNKAIAIDPHDEDFYYNRGLSYAKQNNLKQALADFTRAIEINPNTADAYTNRGTGYFRQGKLTEAISDYSKSIAIAPNNVEIYNIRGGAYAKEGDIDRSISDCNKAIEINPHYADAYLNRALGYFMKEEYVKGWEDVRKAQSLGEKLDPKLIKELKYLSGNKGGGHI